MGRGLNIICLVHFQLMLGGLGWRVVFPWSIEYYIKRAEGKVVFGGVI